MFIADKVELKKDKNGRSLFAKKDIQKDEKILEFEKHFVNNYTKTSLQIDKNLYQESLDANSKENFLNHSCNPNCYIDFKFLTLRSLRKIIKREELNFNYNTSEWELKIPFECKCSSNKCIKEVKGFKYLNRKQRQDIKKLVSPFLKLA